MGIWGPRVWRPTVWVPTNSGYQIWICWCTYMHMVLLVYVRRAIVSNLLIYLILVNKKKKRFLPFFYMWLLWDSNPRSECTWTWNKPLWPLGKTAYVFLFPFLLYPLWPLGYRGFTPWVGFEPTKHNAADFVSENNELLLGKMFIVFRRS